MMTRKHYEQFANMMSQLNGLQHGAQTPREQAIVNGVLATVENALVSILGRDNERFDAKRFRGACRREDRKRR
jgi:hypothetical protein